MKFLKVFGFVSSFVAPSPAAVPVKISNPDISGEILLTAKDLLKKHGWAQHATTDYQGRICASKAINMATDEVIRKYKLEGHTAAAGRRRANDRFRDAVGHSSISAWNDGVCWNRWQVRNAFTRAAKKVN